MTDEDMVSQIKQESTIKPPKGWEPFTEEVGAIGNAIVKLPRPSATEHDLLVQAGFDPDGWRISGPVNTRKWMNYYGDWLYYYKFDTVQEAPHVEQAHIDELTKLIRRRSFKRAPVPPGFDGRVLVGSDWQIGKREGDIGTDETVRRVLDVIEQEKREVKDLRRAGYAMPTGVFVGTGDLLEGTCGYPNQQFLIDRNRREQNRIVRELLTHIIDELAPLYEFFHIATVGGNHGENRNDGSKVADDGDNDDVGVFEAVKEAFDMASRYGAGPDNLTWQIPDDELSIAFDVAGVKIGAAHGHQFGTGATAQQKAVNWWRGQDFGFQVVRDSQILLTSHFHHPSEATYGTRTHLQSGAMDPGSKWFTDRTGDAAPPSTLAFRVDPNDPLGFTHKRLLSPRS